MIEVKFTHSKKFSIGDVVKVRDEVMVGGRYYSEGGGTSGKFTSRMKELTNGKIAKIVDATGSGYVLDIDEDHVYYAGMLEIYDGDIDVLAQSDEIAPEVYLVIHDLTRENIKREIDRALDNRLHETDPEQMNKLYEMSKVWS